MAKVQIVVGSVMGTALDISKAAKALLEGFGHDVILHESFDRSVFNSADTLLVCTSTTGMGDLPENIMPFVRFLLESEPNIDDMHYGVIGLGDSSYLNFAEGGNTIDALLADRGAKRLGEPLILDAILVDDHEEEASQWLTNWQQLLPQ